jgi:hypothetical protein
MESLCDAFQVPKPLSPQLLPFGKSDDDFGELTFEVVQFFCSVRVGRTVRGGVGGRSARVLFVGCSSCSCSPFVSIRGVFEFWLDEVSDGPHVPGGRSSGAWGTVRVLPVDGPFFEVRYWRFSSL